MSKVLIIEDSEHGRHAIRRTLNRNGYTVIESENGKNAIDLIEKFTPDLVLTDIVMPEMDGLEFIRWIRKNRPNLPVVVMSGKNTIYLRIAMQLGASYALEKPFDEKELISILNKILL